jgi:hypothetical protein
MKMKYIAVLICMLLTGTAILPVSGMVKNEISESSNPSKAACVNGNFNLVQQLNPTRIISPRIYLSGNILGNNNIATLDAMVINEGPDDSNNFTLELKLTRIFGLYSGVLYDVEAGEYGSLNAGYRRHVYINLECRVTNNFFNFGINAYEAQITNTADDLNSDDNIASFIFIVIGF